jgi:phenylacetate-CoA ligase
MNHDMPAEHRLDRAELEQLQLDRLRCVLAETQQAGGFYARKYPGVDVASLSGFAGLPYTTRGEIEADQAANPPFGTLPTLALTQYTRFHQTSGSQGEPLKWLDTPQSWTWWKQCWRTIYDAAQIADGQPIMYPFSFGPFIGFWSAFESAAERGQRVLAGGGMTTAARLRMILEQGVAAICCTPTYALRMVEVAHQEGMDLRGSNVSALIVAGEPGGSVGTIRERMEAGWSARVFDHAGMTEIGAWGFECPAAPGGVHVMEDQFIAEIRELGSGQILPGGRGELVLTNLGRCGMPLIRYRTGDIVDLRVSPCPCGRSLAWLDGGILGRVDDMLFVRGNNVFPAAIEGILRSINGITEFRIAVRQCAELPDLEIEFESSLPDDANAMIDRIVAAFQDQLHFKPRVKQVPDGTLPRFEMKAKRWVR